MHPPPSVRLRSHCRAHADYMPRKRMNGADVLVVADASAAALLVGQEEHAARWRDTAADSAAAAVVPAATTAASADSRRAESLAVSVDAALWIVVCAAVDAAEGARH